MRRRVLTKKKPFDIPLSDYVALYDTNTGEYEDFVRDNARGRGSRGMRGDRY